LDDLGLLAALRWYAGEVKERSNLPVSITVEGTPQPISPTVKTALFRVAQEALINVIKHADANHVYIKLFFEDQKVGIWVEDDGCGFDVGKIRGGERQSWGLMGMEERANLLGGEFRLDSEEGVGTKILVTLPNTELIEDEDEDTSVDRG
jgi:two-component system sensor histidine kinase DegS